MLERAAETRDVSDELDVLKLVATRFETAGIAYMVSGSVAMSFYAQPRMTRDIDIARGDPSMNDTSPEVAALYRRLLMRRSGAERLSMACEMFDTARALMRANLTATRDIPDEIDLRVHIFLRTYGSDFGAEERALITAGIRAHGAR